MYRSKYDLALIAAARGGEHGAILTLLACAQPDIRRYARRSCSGSQHIDDVVQETLWLLYRRVGTLRTLTSISGWLLAIVRRECLRLAARFSAQARQSLDQHPDHSPRAQHSDQDLRLDLAAAIESLPDHYRDVVILRDIEEMTVDEIAIALGFTRESVKGRLHRARGLLREYLDDTADRAKSTPRRTSD
ncbi:MAG: sigma-70 family RNA polymerase sigma factor [Pseudomonadota bacterium]